MNDENNEKLLAAQKTLAIILDNMYKLHGLLASKVKFTTFNKMTADEYMDSIETSGKNEAYLDCMEEISALIATTKLRIKEIK